MTDTPKTDRYLVPNQSETGPRTAFEDALGDAIETAYAAGTHDLDGLVAHLNRAGPAHPDGRPWTAETFTILMAELGR